jgi:hypothetical protein
MRIDRNGRVDQLAREGSSPPLIRPEPAIGISAKVVGQGVIQDWRSRKHRSISSP